MNNELMVLKVNQLNEHDLSLVERESAAEGFRHIRRLIDDYASGTNRFDLLGEALFVAVFNGEVVGIGGLNRYEEYISEDTDEQQGYSAENRRHRFGRVRHVYVLSSYRRKGIARAIMLAVLEVAREHFDHVVLRTSNPEADRFYRSLGFGSQLGNEQVTHVMNLDKGC
jgi:GNAT superfamily N-acetyltransferase